MTSPSLSALVAERYGARGTDAREPAAQDGRDVLRTLLGHRSVRDYSATPIGDETLGLLLAAAQSAACSSMGVAGRWSEHSAQRVSSPAALRGRDRLSSALRLLGFPLR
jgi:hypothetical protein